MHVNINQNIRNEVFSFGQVSLSPGGNAMNVARQINRFGGEVQLYSVLGDDPVGQMISGILRQEELNCNHIVWQQNSKTTTVCIQLSKQQPPRLTVEVGEYTKNGVMEALRPFFNQVKPGEPVFIPAYPEYAPLFDNLSLSRGEIFADCGYAPYSGHLNEYKQAIVRILNKVNYALVSGFSFRQEDFHFIKEELEGRRCQAVLVTFAGRGVLWITSDQIRYLETEQVIPINSIGAGDCFFGSFMYFMKNHYSLMDSIQFAHKAASWKVQQFDSLPYLQDIGNLMDGLL
nr:PfkB family carbohydrate kinase [Paenibacillus periandrae]